MACSVTSSLSNGMDTAPRRFLTVADYEELVEARRSGKGPTMWWPCAEDLKRRRTAPDSLEVGLEVDTSSDVETHVTDGSELTSSFVTEGSEFLSSASAAAFAAAQAAADGGKNDSASILSEMQRLRMENLRLVGEMDKLRKSRGEVSEVSTDCSTPFHTGQHCDDDLCSKDSEVVDRNTLSNSIPMKSTPGGKMREWIRAHSNKKKDALEKDRGFLSCAPRPSRAPFASSVSQLFGQPDPGLELVWDPQVGERLEAAIKLTLRELEAMDSPEVQKLPRGVLLRIEELGQMNRNRVKISLDDGKVGWISILDKKVHRPLLGRRKTVTLSDSDGEGVE